MSWCRIRHRKKGGSDTDSITSSSDEDGACPRRNKSRKQAATCRPVSACLKRLRTNFDSRLEATNCACYIFYLLFGLLLLGFLYWYGLTLLSQISRLIRVLLQAILPASWMKSTRDIVQEALAKYSADRLGLADYALESTGGTVLCSSETYYSKSGPLYSLFGIPLWYHTSTPREVIQPDVQPGKCWAMDGSQGFVTIRLAMPVAVTAVSLEHIPKQVSPSGQLDSAPKEFLVLGQEHTLDSPEVLLGTFIYTTDMAPIQVFDIKDPDCIAKSTDGSNCSQNRRRFNIVTMKVLSNYGNKEYTCIYRFRVHGTP